MALYSKRQYADLAGVPTNNLSNYIKRGHVVLKGGKPCKCTRNKCSCLIDGDDPKNQLFLEQHGVESSVVPTPPASPPRSSKTVASSVATPSVGKGRLVQLQEERISRQNDELEKRGRLLDAKIQKVMEEVVPLEHVAHLIMALVDAVEGAWMRASDTLVKQFAAANGMSREETVKWRMKLIDITNAAKKDGHAEAKRNLRKLAKAHAGTKEVGERDDL